MTTERNDHLSAEGIQAFLEGELPNAEASALQDHVSSCARCGAEVEAFRLLFAELGTLPELVPSEHFAERVMGELPSRLERPLIAERPERAERAGQAERARAGAKSRLGAWLGGFLPQGVQGSAHPSDASLQDYIEGVLPKRQQAGVLAHVSACGDCELEVQEWRRLFGSIEALPEFAPAEDFRERVMARVRVPEPAPATVPAHAAVRDQARALVERVRPRTRRGWAMAAGIAMSPGLAFAAVTYLIMSHPLLTFGYLAAFLWWQVTGALSTLATAILNPVLESVTTFRAFQAMEALVASPAMATASLITLGALMMTALWIFYRNFILSPTVAGHDAR